ncbi:MAG: diguanylate cyclase [Gemmatimonadota bacterium]
MAGGAVTQEERIAALRAGAWEVMTLPVDAEELLLRLGRYTRAKLESERIQDVSLTDPVTGLYSRSGVLQRATELTAAAARYGRPLACIVFEAAGDEIADSGALARELAQVLKRYTRRSDVVGRLGPSQFAIVAPDTAREGAEVVATRLRQAGLESAREGLRAGVFVFSEPGDFQLDATELLQRAASATQGPGAPGLN